MVRYNNRHFAGRPAGRLYLVGTLLAALLLATSCNKEDIPDDGMQPTDNTGYSITVTDGGFSSADTPRTRAVEEEYATEFTEGDRAGLYAVDQDDIVLENVPVTATNGTNDEIVWTLPDGTSLSHSEQTNYFLYYPYQAEMTGKVEAYNISSAEKFFSTLILEWRPKADQREYAAYTASDLMVAKGTVGKITEKHLIPLTFTMKHCMALAVVEAPDALYRVTSYNSGKTKCDITIYQCSGIKFDGEAQPYPLPEKFVHRYRYIVNPMQGFILTGSYIGPTNEYKYDFKVNDNQRVLTAGCYTSYPVDGGREEKTGDYHEMGIVRIGDLFCSNEGITDWYLSASPRRTSSKRMATPCRGWSYL